MPVAYSPKSWASYWRHTLIDAGLASLTDKIESLPRSPSVSIRDGRLSSETTQRLFTEYRAAQPPTKTPSEEIKSIPVLIAPYIAEVAHDHQRQKKAKPVIPLWVPAQLSLKGELTASPDRLPWIPREYLEPTDDSANSIILGTVEQIDEALNQQEKPAVDAKTGLVPWGAWLRYALDRLPKHWRTTLQEAEVSYVVARDQSLVIVATPDNMVGNIVKVYEHLARRDEDVPPLFASYCEVRDIPRRSLWTGSERRSREREHHLGHLSEQYPLSPTQRETIAHVLVAKPADLLAVNGPPGTGKTTLLHALWSSLWIVEALKPQGRPPVFVVSSTNNQAVTNVLDSLASLAGTARWLPSPLKGLGLYLVRNPQKQEEADKKGHHWMGTPGGLFAALETPEFVATATESYLARAQTFLGATGRAVSLSTVKEVCRVLQADMIAVAGALRTLSESSESLHILTKRYPQGLGDAVKQSQEKQDQNARSAALWRQANTDWTAYIAQEPLWLAFLGILPPVRVKRQARDRLFLTQHQLRGSPWETYVLPKQRLDLEARLALGATQSDKALQEATHSLQEVCRDRDRWLALQATCQAIAEDPLWRLWVPEAINQPTPDPLLLEDPEDPRNPLIWADTTLRLALFRMAVPYWEGRWLIEIGDILSERSAGKKPKDDRQRPTERRRTWQRHAMLTPCFVTTLHTGPGFFDYYNAQDDKPPHYECLDWLILDEGGQIAPETAGAMIALARRAIVVGDRQQIRPVWSVLKSVDVGNVGHAGLLDKDIDYETLADTALLSASGSLMEVAQRRTGFHKGEEYEPGFFLAEHRRCVDPIIQYCNDMAYNGRMVLKRGMSNIKDPFPFPHMGYAHIPGESRQTPQGSRTNAVEADTVAQWLKDHREEIGRYYGDDDIAKHVGIVTPFKAQEHLLRKALKSAGITLDKCGTVHSLQGAEKRIILFSPVYTTEPGAPSSLFFDRSNEMLNVAVSRARDSFLVFGDMGIFRPGTASPSQWLAQHLFRRPENELPVSIVRAQWAQDEIRRCFSVEDHDRLLTERFKQARQRLVISSPFISGRAIQATHIVEVIRETCARGVAVIIYTSSSKKNEGWMQHGLTLLKESPAVVHVVHNLHSKMMMQDDDLLVEGSFNWLSAERSNPEHQNLDTSIVYQGEHARGWIQKSLTLLEALKEAAV